MLIQPDGVIKILRNVPLNNKYEHTIYFENDTDQYNYFTALKKHELTKQSYQRFEKGVLTVQLTSTALFDCNYIMFKNISFENKWFYAFITSIEYVNNITTRISYQLDVMQTWFFNYELKPCYVDREHSVTDVVGENTVPENLETGEYISKKLFGLGENPTISSDIPKGDSVVFASTFNADGDDITARLYGHIYGGLLYHVFPMTPIGLGEATNFLENNAGKSDGIVTAFQMPTAFVKSADTSLVVSNIASYIHSIDKQTDNYNESQNKSPYNFNFNNKKLLTYPYNFMYVTNLQGQSAVFPYEFFTGDTCDFTISGDMSCEPTLVLAPNNYKGVSENYDEKLVLTGFPKCPFNIDTFKQWLQLNSVTLATSAAGLASNMIMQGALQGASNVAFGLSGVIGGVLNSAGNAIQHSIMPDHARTGSGSNLMYSLGNLKFHFYNRHIKDEYAKIIDNYFDMFGYATHRVKVPNINSRPHWNYVKTIGCIITGSIPSDDIKDIADIYNNGITFWKNGNEIGDYSLDNKPV